MTNLLKNYGDVFTEVGLNSIKTTRMVVHVVGYIIDITLEND